MAKVQIPKQPTIKFRLPTKIEKFLGLNEDTSGDTQLLLGESPSMPNYRLTENYKLRKREGYLQLFATLGVHNIQGMWYGKLAGTFYFLLACNGNVYKCNLATGVNTSIGTLTDAKTSFFGFGTKVYMLNGNEYKSYDGTTFATVAGYVPLVATATPPAGGGTANEGINLLTGKKYQRFSGNAVATVYQVAETALTSVDAVWVDGVLKTVTTDYTVNLTTGVITPVPAAKFTLGVDNIDIYWTKGTGSRAEVTANFYAMFFGGQNDSRVFAYGDGTNRYYYTGLAAGVPSAEYWPALNYREISTAEFAVTDIIRQYDRQLIYTNGGETWYSYYNPITLTNGDVIADFPTFPLNNTVGNLAYGQAQLIQNNPFSIQNGVHEWVATNVRDERNAVYKSKRVEPSLAAVDLTTAVTVDWEAKGEYWLAIGTDVWVYNYRLDKWYRFVTYDSIACFEIINDALYFGTTNGQIMKFDASYRTDNGHLITSVWEMNFYDFHMEWLQKYLTEMWITLKPEDKSSVAITYQTDRSGDSDTYTARYNLTAFGNVDFGDFTFLVNYNPQPFHFAIRADKFAFFKLFLTNAQLDEKLTVLSIILPIKYGSNVT